MYNLVCVRGADFRKAFRNETPATLSAIAALGARSAPARNRNLPPSPYFSLKVETASETAAWPPGAWQTFVSSWNTIMKGFSWRSSCRLMPVNSSFSWAKITISLFSLYIPLRDWQVSVITCRGSNYPSSVSQRLAVAAMLARCASSPAGELKGKKRDRGERTSARARRETVCK